MRRRSAFLLALAVGLATVATLLLARRGRAINAAPAPAAMTPPPAGPATKVVRSAPTPPAEPDVQPQAETTEQPLATWVRVAIVAAALLAFLAVSMIATKD